MAFINLIFTALSLKKLQTALVEEKLEAIKSHEDKTYKQKFKFRHIGVNIRKGLKKLLKKWLSCSETCRGYKTCYKLGHEGSCENYALKSALGFIGGVFLTYLLYIFFIFQLNIKLTSATVICSVLGCVLNVGLAFSSRIRCIVLLTLPQFFSKRGRQALLAYAFVLALTGPAQNTLNNMGILSESLACGQEQLKQAVKQIIDVIKKPFMAIKEAIKKVVKTVKEIVKKIKEILLKIKRIIMALVRVIKSVFEFLGRIINICNKELGTPFERCTRVFENAIADCNAKLGPLFSWLCSITYIVKAVCYIVKVFDYVCILVDFISNSVVGVIIRKIKIFVRHIKTMFYVRIKFSHSFKYQTVSSKSMTEIAKEIVAEIKGRSKGIVAFFNFMTSASMLFFMYLVFQVTFYRIKYLTSEKFDNIYINKYFREIDQRRAKIGKETVLPLTKKERQTYVPINSGALARTEKRQLSKSATALATASLKLGTHMAADYCLYWILTMISYHARYQSKIQAPNFPVAHITGEGFLAKLLRSIVDAFQPVGIKLEIDTVPCLPIPIPPDFDRYAQIAITVTICWILTVLEPYGLRFRNFIMGYYHPVRAKQRTIWLYNHILRSRASFLLLARRSLRKKFNMKGRSDEISCKDLLKSKLNCGIFRICFGGEQKACLLCGEIFRERDKKNFVKCHTPNCPGLFCVECFADLKNICPICLSPIEYGDLEGLDEEQDSSGDEPPPDKPKKRRCPWFPCGKADDNDDDKELLIPEKDIKKEPDSNQELKDDLKQPAEESDSSTDYSYSYQYDEDYKMQEPLPSQVIWKDVEMQAVHDEASMDSFREGDEFLCIDLENQIRLPKGHAAVVKLDVLAEDDDDDKKLHDDDDDDNNAHFITQETEPLLSTCTCSLSTTPKHVEFIGVPKVDRHKNVRHKLLSDSLCNCSEPLHSTTSTSTRSDCKYCKCSDIDIKSTLKAGSETEEELRNIVPKLDLSFLDKRVETCTCDNPILSSRFSYVCYQEECETLASSSILSSLQNSPNTEKIPLLRRRHGKTGTPQTKQNNHETQYSTPEVGSPSSMDSYEFNKAQNRKAKQYYNATKQMCSDTRCHYGRKRASIADMFRKLLPKRKGKQNYLPLQRRDIDDTVQIQSYNYNQNNWDTLSLDTNSPTYPFASQIPSDTSEEEQKLLPEKRIRGGECKHLINCQLIGKECARKRVRSFDAKSRTQLKDFSTLSLPPKPKAADSKELFSRYFLSTKSPENSMQPNESIGKQNLADRQDSSDYILPKDQVLTSIVGLNATPPSSDSGLSDSTCAALFGTNCPQRVKNILPESLEDITTEDINITESTKSAVQEIDSGRQKETSIISIKQVILEIPSKESQQSQINSTLKVNAEERKEITTRSIKKDSLELVSGQSNASYSKDPIKTPSEIRKTSQIYSIREELVNDNSKQEKTSQTDYIKKESQTIIDKKPGSSESHKSQPSLQCLKEKGPSEIFSEIEIAKKSASVETAQTKVSKQSSKDTLHDQLISENQSNAKRKSAQLNQLLYKDDKTEISLVQKISPGKTATKSQTLSPPLSPRTAPSVKLKISLHNSIIPEEDLPEGTTIESVTMESPRSQDKIVETQDSFPLQCNCISSDSNKTGKLILSSDKTQQTSDNDIYRSLQTPGSSSERKMCTSCSLVYNYPQISSTDEPTRSSLNARYKPSEIYYSNEIPERDTFCKNDCECSICRERQKFQNPHAMYKLTHESPTNNNCGCCRCGNAMPLDYQPQRSMNNNNYVFPPSTTDTEIPEFLPPLPPLPPKFSPKRAVRRAKSPLTYQPACSEQCNCRALPQYFEPYSGDAAYPSAPPQMNRYGYQGKPNKQYNIAYEDNLSDSSNPDYSLSDLPYQNNEEYLQLVHELQDTLHSRNRSRVKRAMKEFENRSKQNMPLEKPIIDYDESSESEEPIIRKIDQLRNDRKTCCAGEKCGCTKKKEPKSRRETRRQIDERPSHWTIDPEAGGWHKTKKHSRRKGHKSSKEGEFDQYPCNCDCRYQ